MIDYLECIEKDEHAEIHDLLDTLNTVNYQLAELATIKETLEQKLNVLIGHADEGSKTYNYGKYNVTLTSGWNYSLDKDEYAIHKNQLQPCFDPVRQKISFEIDKKILKDVEKYGCEKDMEILATFITQKPKKLHCKITSAT